MTEPSDRSHNERVPGEKGSPNGDRAAERLLVSHGADTIAHPGGTLLAHLRRVTVLLLQWGAPPAVRTAGLCHAFYGTDGFHPSLLGLAERDVLVRAIGLDVEAIVYLYASCDRAAVYPRVGGDGPLNFTDRFTGFTSVLEDHDASVFMEITAANELDVVTHNGALASERGADLLDLFERGRKLLSPSAWEACEATLYPAAGGKHAAASEPPTAP